MPRGRHGWLPHQARTAGPAPPGPAPLGRRAERAEFAPEAASNRQTEGPGFDPEVLLDSCGDNPALIREILGMALTSISERLERIQAAIAAGDGRKVAWEAHTLKGVFLTVGAEGWPTPARP